MKLRGTAVFAAVLVLSGCAASEARPATDAASRPATLSPTPSPVGQTAAPQPAEPSPISLTVMTYNTLTGKNDCAGCRALRRAGLGDELRLGARMPKAAEKVELADPDIIGFQENEGADPLPQAHLAPLLADYTWVLADRTVPIAVRTERFHVLDKGSLALESEPVRCLKRDKTNGRFVVWAKLHDLESQRELWVFNTHLHPYNDKKCAKLRAKNVARLTALIEEKVADRAQPLIVTGDFNAYGDEQRSGFRDHLDTLTGIGLVDTHAVAERDDSDVPGAASAGWLTAKVKGASHPKVIRVDDSHIDYVWVPEQAEVSSWKVLSGPGFRYKTIDGVEVPYWPGVVPSDHSPVVAEVVIP